MTLAIILVVVAAIALLVILRLAFPTGLLTSGAAIELQAQEIQPIDIEAFRMLIDPAESQYLFERLPAGEFRMVQRQRLRAMAAYIQAAQTNSALLARIGQHALTSADSETVEAARQLVDSAVLLRRNATVALGRLYLSMIWPTAVLMEVPILHGYQQLNNSAMRLGRLQNPAVPVRIAMIS